MCTSKSSEKNIRKAVQVWNSRKTENNGFEKKRKIEEKEKLESAIILNQKVNDIFQHIVEKFRYSFKMAQKNFPCQYICQCEIELGEMNFDAHPTSQHN